MNRPEGASGYEAYAAIALIGEEHRFLRRQFDALHANLKTGVELAAIADHAKRFMAVTAEHFLHEEWAMRISRFPDMAVHQVNHRRFINDAEDMINRLSSSACLRQEGMAVADIYWDWIDYHQEFDRRFAEYSQEILDARELIFDTTQEFNLKSPKAIGERRFAAVLCVDVADFARLVDEDEVGTIAEWCSCWHEIVTPIVIAHDGRIVKSTGDGFIAEFELCRDAVQCALAIQTAVNERKSTVSPCQPLMLRMGVHACHVVPCGTDIFGHGVNIAARLQAEAVPGTIYISESAWRTIGPPEAFDCIDIGFRRLRHIDEPLHVYVIEPQQQHK